MRDGESEGGGVGVDAVVDLVRVCGEFEAVTVETEVEGVEIKFVVSGREGVLVLLVLETSR